MPALPIWISTLKLVGQIVIHLYLFTISEFILFPPINQYVGLADEHSSTTWVRVDTYYLFDWIPFLVLTRQNRKILFSKIRLSHYVWKILLKSEKKELRGGAIISLIAVLKYESRSRDKCRRNVLIKPKDSSED